MRDLILQLSKSSIYSTKPRLLSNWQAIYHNIPAMNSPLTCRHFFEKRLFYKSLHLVQSIQSS
ncbi:hypothetical protein ACR92V_25550, partial [Klebsiella pneumoniae]